VQQWAENGIAGVLSGLHRRVQWRPPVLEIRDFVDTDLYLDGRGIRLQPSFFCWQAPTKLRDRSLPPVLVYPTAPPPGTLHRGRPGGPQRLTALVGATRAAALEATVAGCTTSELARRCGVSPAAASQQATVLRGAGLISTRRDGGAVRHEITTLGLSLLSTGL
jgi:DNA-binding transcriptional ArsR family regulator